MKQIVVTYAFNAKSHPGMPQFGMQVFKMEGLARVDQWNDMMERIEEANLDIVPNTICVLYTKELLNT